MLAYEEFKNMMAKKMGQPKNGNATSSRASGRLSLVEEESGPPRYAELDQDQRRSAKEIQDCVQYWRQLLHRRQSRFFATEEQRDNVLEQLARYTSNQDDLTAGYTNQEFENRYCVEWYGETTADESHAILQMVKPPSTTPTPSLLNRVM